MFRSTKSGGDNKPKPAESHQHMPWVEKYRPRRVEDVVFQDEVVAVLKKILEGADVPHMLFYGAPGTGKTSAAVALCRQLFKGSFGDRVLELNASDERGINIVRQRVKEFSQRAVVSSNATGLAGLKIVILDEADAMTSAAQSALRRTMEKQCKTTRFILICNYISRIIEPLTSRCAKFRFKPLPVENQVERLRWICEQEGVKVEDEALTALVEVSEGDLRRAVTCLQTTSRSYSKLGIDTVRSLAGVVPQGVVDDFLTACRSLDFESLMRAVESIRREGWSAASLLGRLREPLATHPDLRDLQKAQIFHAMAECEMCLYDGSDEFLQLLSFATTLQEEFKESD